MYSKFPIIWIPIICIPIIWILNYPNTWTSPCFWQQWEKKNVVVTGGLLQEKAKLLYERLFPDGKHRSTLYYNVAT